MGSAQVTLLETDNQARGLGEFALNVLAGQFPPPSLQALERVEWFHTDSLACSVSALALKTNAPTVLREEALEYAVPVGRKGATCLGSARRVWPEKAVAANCAAAREWDSNGTNFGYLPALQQTAGEFGHNDYYPVVIAAAQQTQADGFQVARAMLLLDEIRGRLAAAFALRKYKIDHVVHGAIASAAVYAAMLGGTVDQIESAIGMVVAHYIPFRAIRAGKQLSDSKGASAALSAEVAVMSASRALRGFVGPADIFRNPEAIFCLFEKPKEKGRSPFQIHLTGGGDDFATQEMHFKLGLYEHQSAGALQGLLDLLAQYPRIMQDESSIEKIEIEIYEPAFGIIGDPAKHDPQTRQSADHSMLYIVSTLLRKALERKVSGWEELMLLPADYDDAALHHPVTRALMKRIQFRHGGPEYDAKYPDGIPTKLTLQHAELGPLSSGFVMHPLGHSRCPSNLLASVLQHKWKTLSALGVADVPAFLQRCAGLATKTAAEIDALYNFPILHLPPAN